MAKPCRKCGGTDRYEPAKGKTTGACKPCKRAKSNRWYRNTSPPKSTASPKVCINCGVKIRIFTLCRACASFDCEVCECRSRTAEGKCANEASHERLLKWRAKAKQLRKSSKQYDPDGVLPYRIELERTVRTTNDWQVSEETDQATGATDSGGFQRDEGED